MAADPARLVFVLLALQFAAFGWRVNREISLGDERRRIWLPLPDWLNVISFVALLLSFVLAPLTGYSNPLLNKILLGGSSIILAMHPINMAAHYRLFSRKGRSIYEDQTKYRDIPLVTDQEWCTLIFTLLFVAVASILIARA